MPPSAAGEFAERLRTFREAAALTQEELAERARLSPKAVGALERGERRRPFPNTVRALADALGLSERERLELIAAARPTTDPNQPPALELPVPASTLIGRQAELAEVVTLLSSGARLLTLTGPGGVGKTRLSLEIAREVAPDFAGVTLVELAAVRDAALVAAEIAQALAIRQVGSSVLDAVAAALGARRQLLVLDNLEHLLPAAPQIAELVARCPGVAVLVTSRAPLRVRAEREFLLGPLAVPDRDDVDAVMSSPAAQVFLDRARATGRVVDLSPATAGDVAAICQRLGGLPLALELAAAHARLLPPPVLLTRLDDAVGSPRTARDLPDRQRTLRATLDWSHDLLTLDEQVMLRRLAILVGDFSLEAAEALVQNENGALAPLAGLVEQSLVVRDTGAAGRYRMLEPIREYAAARLGEAGESDDVADRAAGFFLALAGGARDGLRGADLQSCLERLEQEHANLAASLARLVERGDLATAARFGADSWLYWSMRGNTAEGLALLQRVEHAALDAPLRPADLAALHLAMAGLHWAAGDIGETRRLATSAVRAAGTAGTEVLLAEALVLACSAALFAGDLSDATTLITDALEHGRRVGGWADLHAVIARGQLLLRAGEYEASAASLDDAIARARRMGNPFSLATALNVRATLAQLTGDPDTALETLLEAVELSAKLRTKWTLVYALPGLAALAAQRGRPGLAAELFAAGSLTAEAGSIAVSFPPARETAQRWLDFVRDELGDIEYHRAWERGRGLRLEDIPQLAAAITTARPDRHATSSYNGDTAEGTPASL